MDAEEGSPMPVDRGCTETGPDDALIAHEEGPLICIDSVGSQGSRASAQNGGGPSKTGEVTSLKLLAVGVSSMVIQQEVDGAGWTRACLVPGPIRDVPGERTAKGLKAKYGRSPVETCHWFVVRGLPTASRSSGMSTGGQPRMVRVAAAFLVVSPTRQEYTA
ncbi:hypothetical protein CMUS01_08313 [Colletotrichum musicola]|uniref:Uncharacterized protein n=1 Tax=Colletotrichum musicola TaxID=2175873 RepID=A0A8H6KDF9_9PEZI|nr:hypothetical protein CMUS01_08313 [Colletotrichum musicola]